jgi:hypothetical protein
LGTSAKAAGDSVIFHSVLSQQIGRSGWRDRRARASEPLTVAVYGQCLRARFDNGSIA